MARKNARGICSIEGCRKAHKARGWCGMHYWAWRVNGDPMNRRPQAPRTAAGWVGTPEYNTWKGMKQRCRDPNVVEYKYYGGRGIKYCDRWEIFSNFLEDMGARPKGLTLDRMDVDGDYTPENCRWVDWITQASNKRNLGEQI